MTQEEKIAIGVMQIAAAQSNGICTFKRAYAEIPRHVKLSAGNVTQSIKRPREPMWHQIVRNIKSHQGKGQRNFIDEGLLVHIPRVGYQVTPKGLSFLKQHGFA